MSEFSIFHWMVVLAIILVLFFGKRIFPRPGDGPSQWPTHASNSYYQSD